MSDSTNPLRDKEVVITPDPRTTYDILREQGKLKAPDMSDTLLSSSTRVSRDTLPRHVDAAPLPIPTDPDILAAELEIGNSHPLTADDYLVQGINVKPYEEGILHNGEVNLPDVVVTGEMPRSYMGIPVYVYHSDLSRRMYEDRNKAGRDIALGMAAVAAAPIVVPVIASAVSTAAPYVASAVNTIGKVFTPSTYTNWVLPYFGASLGTAATVGTLADAGWTGYWGYQSGKNAIQHPENLTTFWDYALLPFDVVTTAAGAAGARRAFNAGRGAFRLAAYDNITPFAYDKTPGSTVSKWTEIGNAVKSYFTKDIPTGSEYIPKWMRQFNKFMLIGQAKGTGLSEDAILNLRNQAWRKAMRLQETDVNNIYIPNGDGTFRYDYDAIARINNGKVPKYKVGRRPFKNGLEYWYDLGATNGGAVSLKPLKNGDFEMIDKWDLLPFKEKYRAPGKFGKFISNIPLIRNIDVVTLSGGKPFVLKQRIKPWEIEGF